MDQMRAAGLARRRWAERPLADPRILAAGYVSFAIFAGLIALLSSEPIHRLWGAWAACGYGLATLIMLAWRSRGAVAALCASVTGAVLIPLTQLAATGRYMPEVGVIERAAALLLHHGTPYLPAAQLTSGYLRYNPYLPAMTVFGLPHALFGPGLLTDPRLWAAAVFVALCTAAFWVSGLGRLAAARTGPGRTGPGRAPGGVPLSQCIRLTAFGVATPLIAFPLAVSGNDLPVLGLMCLGLAVAVAPGPARGASAEPDTHGPADWTGPSPRGGIRGSLGRWATASRGHPVAAGVLLGLAGGMKATAWPAVPVACALLAARYGPRAATRFAVAAGAVLAVILAPWAIAQPGALIRNTVLFPLGLSGVKSPAASPLPGHLLASAAGHPGHLIAIVLLAAAGVAVTGSLILRPPASLAAATARLAIGLALMFGLAPASRWGYFVYPAGLLGWLWLSGQAQEQEQEQEQGQGPASSVPRPDHRDPVPALTASEP